MMTFRRRGRVTTIQCNGTGCKAVAVNRVPDEWDQVTLEGRKPRHYCPTCDPSHDPTLKRLRREADE